MPSQPPPPAANTSYAALSPHQLTLLREHALSWLCHDKGLVDVLYPRHADTPAASPEARITHAKAVVAALLNTQTEGGRAASARTYTREAAARLRRMTARLVDGTFTHRDVAKMSVLLEGVWDDVNTPLSDRAWARCSMRFDTALITLRVTYVLAYLDAEVPSRAHPLVVRKAVFRDLVTRFFAPDAPTDDTPEKHSSGFKKLRDAWRAELVKYVAAADFDDKIAHLGTLQTPAATAKYVLAFMRELGVDHSWLLDALKLDADVAAGALVRPDELDDRPRRRGRQPRKPAPPRKKKAGDGGATQRDPRPVVDEILSSSSSSFEPAQKDSDYDVEDDAQQQRGDNDDDEDDLDASDDDDAQVDSPESRRRRRRRRAQRDGDMVRRSLRVARAGVKRATRKRSRKGPERFSELEYPATRAQTPDGKLMTRKSRRAALEDDEPGYDGGEHDASDDDDADDVVVEAVARGGAAQATRRRARGDQGRVLRSNKARRVLHGEDDDVPLRASTASNEVMRLSQQLDPDSGTFESTGVSDVDEHVADMVRRRRVVRALAKVDLREKGDGDDDDDDEGSGDGQEE